MNSNVTVGSFTATDGMRVEYFTHGSPSSPALVVSPACQPALSGSAEAYAHDFGVGLPGYFVVAVQLRGTLLWNTLSNDYSDVYRVVAQSGMPVLVYGGESSVVPWKAMQWVSEQVPDSEFMLLGKEDGVHAPHLSPPSLREKFMNGVLDFLDRRVRPSTP